MSIQIEKPGLLSTIQDEGRYGLKKKGIIESGAMDKIALRIANLLVGNNENEGAIGITMAGPKIRFMQDCLIAVAGAGISPTINSEPIKIWRPVFVRKGSLLETGSIINGCRAYIAFAGGLNIPVIMGSKSTYLKARIGGWHGRALQAGDIIPLNSQGYMSMKLIREVTKRQYNHSFIEANWALSPLLLPEYDFNSPVRVMKGPEYDLFSAESHHHFWNSAFQVTAQSDRMGYRLQGPLLTRKQPAEMLSGAVTFGTIQVPAEGNPIVLMADHQTTGGYPRIAQVITADLSKLAQVSAGNRVCFQQVTLQQAQQLYFQQEHTIGKIKGALQMKLLETRYINT